MQADDERTLNNLHVLGALAHNDKLMTNGDAFDIYSPTSLRGLLRTWYGERRGQNILRIRQTIRAAISFVERSLEEANALLQTSRAGAPLALRVDTLALQHLRMVEGLTRAQDGLANMLRTYREDATLASQVALTVSEVSDFLRVMAPHSERLRAQCSQAVTSRSPSRLPSRLPSHHSSAPPSVSFSRPSSPSPRPLPPPSPPLPPPLLSSLPPPAPLPSPPGSPPPSPIPPDRSAGSAAAR